MYKVRIIFDHILKIWVVSLFALLFASLLIALSIALRIVMIHFFFFLIVICNNTFSSRQSTAVCIIKLTHLQWELWFELLYQRWCALEVVACLRIVFCESNAPNSWFVKLWAAFSKHLKPKEFWLVIINLWRDNNWCCKVFDEYLRKRCSIYWPVDIEASRAFTIVALQSVWDIRFFTSGTI